MRALCMLLFSTLFGLRNPGDGGRQVVALDPATAAVAPVSASIAPPNATPSGVIALDRGGDRFFFAGTPGAETTPRLYAVSTSSGSVLSSPALEAGTSVQGLEYDEAEDVLDALRSPAASGGKQLVRYDVATGTATAIGATTGPLGTPSGVSTLDAAGNRFFYIGTPDGETTQRLYALSTVTGAVLASPAVDAATSISGLEWDDAADVLYALRTPHADGGKQLVSLNPSTGAATAVSASFGPSLGIASGLTALDGAGNRFFFLATPPGSADARIYSVDTGSGALLGSPAIAGPGNTSEFHRKGHPIDSRPRRRQGSAAALRHAARGHPLRRDVRLTDRADHQRPADHRHGLDPDHRMPPLMGREEAR
jgi:hypothetical protein